MSMTGWRQFGNAPLPVTLMKRDYRRDYTCRVHFRSHMRKYTLFTVTHAGKNNSKLEGKGEYT